MHTATILIVDFQLTQCTETTSSVAMEKHGIEKVLQQTQESLQVGTVVTDHKATETLSISSVFGITLSVLLAKFVEAAKEKIGCLCWSGCQL